MPLNLNLSEFYLVPLPQISFIMIIVQEVKKLIQAGEGHIVDFKRSVPSKVRDITEEVCSFANADGGYVLIGVDNSNRIIRTSIDNKTRSAIQGSISEISPALHVEMYPVLLMTKKFGSLKCHPVVVNPIFFRV